MHRMMFGLETTTRLVVLIHDEAMCDASNEHEVVMTRSGSSPVLRWSRGHPLVSSNLSKSLWVSDEVSTASPASSTILQISMLSSHLRLECVCNTTHHLSRDRQAAHVAARNTLAEYVHI